MAAMTSRENQEYLSRGEYSSSELREKIDFLYS
jgi:hypothetical protein